MKWPTLWRYHPLALAQCHSLLMAPPLRVSKAGIPAPVSAQAPTSPAAPPPPSGLPGAGLLTPAPFWTQDPARARIALLLCPSSAAELVVTTAWAAEDPISTSVEAVLRLSLSVPSRAADLNLFEKEIGWKGEV